MKKNRVCVVVVLAALSGGNVQAQIELKWWHASAGETGKKLIQIAAGFNARQSDYELVPVYKGDYAGTMAAAIAAFRTGQHPHIVQVLELGTATMLAAEAVVYPVYELMHDVREPFDPNAYLAAVSGPYSDSDGKVLAIPFNSSTPVLYYNRQAFALAGLDPASPPATWPAVETAAKKLQESGVPCGFTTGWPSWIQIENFSAWHNVPVGTRSNGFGGLDAKLTFNSPLHVHHINRFAEWRKTGIFEYGGRKSYSASKFYNGECAMYMDSSSAYSEVKNNVAFPIGVAMLPYWPGVRGAPQNSIVDGSGLWVLQGHGKEEYAGVAKFLSYFSSPAVQADWHQSTGYLPITRAAYEMTWRQGFYDNNPGAHVAVQQIAYKKPTANSMGIRLGNFHQIRDAINDELEAVWARRKTAKQGLNDAVTRGNALLRKFDENPKRLNWSQ